MALPDTHCPIFQGAEHFVASRPPNVSPANFHTSITAPPVVRPTIGAGTQATYRCQQSRQVPVQMLEACKICRSPANAHLRCLCLQGGSGCG